MMKSPFFFFLFLFSLQECEAQKAVVANLKMNIAYLGIPNPLGIMAEGYKWEEIDVSTDNGKIERQDEDRIYVFQPHKAGKALITLKAKKGEKKTIGTMEYRIWHIPNPYPMLGGQKSGKVKKSRLLVYPGISCQLDNFDFDIRFVIRTYSVSMYRNDSSLFIKSNIEGPFFSEELKQQFKQTKEGDKLIFYAIIAQGPDKRLLELSPMEFTITE